MRGNVRRQLTLFVYKADSKNIEAIRSTYNPLQRQLIDSHVTLCREDEIRNLEKVIDNLNQLNQQAITISFGQVTRFDNGKGVLIPAMGNNESFYKLRQQVLAGLNDDPGRQEPHITLMHPRNSTCTDNIFELIQQVNLPAKLQFKTISLIAQVNGGKWETLRTYDLAD